MHGAVLPRVEGSRGCTASAESRMSYLGRVEKWTSVRVSPCPAGSRCPDDVREREPAKHLLDEVGRERRVIRGPVGRAFGARHDGRANS